MTDEFESQENPDFGDPGGRRSASPPIVAVLLAAVVAAAVAAFLMIRSCGGDDAVVVTEPPAVPAPAPPPEGAEVTAPPGPPPPAAEGASPAAVEVSPEPGPPPAPPALPPLDGSNELVLELLGGCIAGDLPPLPAEGGSLVRLFVVIVDNAAEGLSPRPHLGFLGFSGTFPVVEREGRLYADPAGYRRYDGIGRVFAGMDAAACAAAYGQVRPLVEEAYRDLGYPERSFDATLGRAIGRVTGVNLPDEDVLLLKGEGVYHYEDPSLEKLSGMARQVIRMGPENGRKLQRSLSGIAAALGLD